MGWVWGVGGACVAAALAVHAHVYRNYHYVCTNCGAEYRPRTFAKSLFALNFDDERVLRCPACGKVCRARVVRDTA